MLLQRLKLSGYDVTAKAVIVFQVVPTAGFSVTGTNAQQRVVRFWPPYCCPLAEDDPTDARLRQINAMFCKDLVKGRAGRITDIVWTDSLLFRFEKARLTEANGKAEIKSGDRIEIGGKTFSVEGADLKYDQPMMIGFRVSQYVPRTEREFMSARAGQVTVPGPGRTN